MMRDMPALEPTNEAIADVLVTMAGLLEEQEANPYRVRAYLNAAQTVRTAARPLVELLNDGGRAALKELPGIGDNIAAHIERFILTRRLHETLGLTSLEDLERAAHDGRLEGLEGMGPRRIQALRDQLNSILSR